MSQNRDAPAYQEYAVTIFGTAAFECRSQAACNPKLEGSYRHPARGDAVRAQNSLVIPRTCTSGFDLFKPSKLPPNSDYGAKFLELRNEGIDARAYRRLIR